MPLLRRSIRKTFLQAGFLPRNIESHVNGSLTFTPDNGTMPDSKSLIDSFLSRMGLTATYLSESGEGEAISVHFTVPELEYVTPESLTEVVAAQEVTPEIVAEEAPAPSPRRRRATANSA